jgi:hypothetical protein
MKDLIGRLNMPSKQLALLHFSITVDDKIAKRNPMRSVTAAWAALEFGDFFRIPNSLFPVESKLSPWCGYTVTSHL